MLAGHSVHPPVGFKAGICRVLIAASMLKIFRDRQKIEGKKRASWSTINTGKKEEGKKKMKVKREKSYFIASRIASFTFSSCSTSRAAASAALTFFPPIAPSARATIIRT